MRDPQEPAERPDAIRPDPALEHAMLMMNRALAESAAPALPPVANANRLAAVFVVGAPRSGTTLLSQLLSRHLSVGYIDNVVARFWMRPSAGIALSRSLLGPAARSRITLESRHGSTLEPEGPHEFGYFWRHWLALDARSTHHPSSEPHVQVDVDGLRKALHEELLGQFGVPVVFKNPICGLHAPSIIAAHPRSTFVHIVRSRSATCASILQSRIDRLGSAAKWWSLKPSNYGSIAALEDPTKQIEAQVDSCREEIDTAIAVSGAESLRVDYEQLCSDPAAVIGTIASMAAPNVVERFRGSLSACHRTLPQN